MMQIYGNDGRFYIDGVRSLAGQRERSVGFDAQSLGGPEPIEAVPLAFTAWRTYLFTPGA